jgi:hypothetical protein
MHTSCHGKQNTWQTLRQEEHVKKPEIETKKKIYLKSIIREVLGHILPSTVRLVDHSCLHFDTKNLKVERCQHLLFSFLTCNPRTIIIIMVIGNRSET